METLRALAVELGLAGPMMATVASPELLDFINWTLLPQLGQYPHGAITGRGEILVPPTEPGDKPRSSCGRTTGRALAQLPGLGDGRGGPPDTAGLRPALRLLGGGDRGGRQTALGDAHGVRSGVRHRRRAARVREGGRVNLQHGATLDR
jgi:hypothetical protein